MRHVVTKWRRLSLAGCKPRISPVICMLRSQDHVLIHWLLPSNCYSRHGPLARYAKFWVGHAPGMPGTLSLPLRVSDPDMHHGACETHVPWCMPGSLASGFLWSRWRVKRPWHSRRMRNRQFYESGKRSVPECVVLHLASHSEAWTKWSLFLWTIFSEPFLKKIFCLMIKILPYFS